MAKTDKELTVEVVNSFISAWFGKTNTNILTGNDLASLIKDVYTSISSLDKSQENS